MFQTRRSKLIYGILFDLIGMASYLGGPFTVVTDIIWAPVTLYIMTKMYPSKIGVTTGIFSAIEELTPGLDIIPTFTITWFLSRILNPEKPSKSTAADSQ